MISQYLFFLIHFFLDKKTNQKNQDSPRKLLRTVHSRNSMRHASHRNSISSLTISRTAGQVRLLIITNNEVSINPFRSIDAESRSTLSIIFYTFSQQIP